MLTDDAIRARVAALEGAASQRQDEREAQLSKSFTKYLHVHPLVDAASSAIEAIENTDDRFMLGLHQIDLRTRGFGAKELVVITGFAHSGKTQLVNTAVLNNKNKRILFFSMDDPAEMILVKLVCMVHNVDAETLEARIRRGDAEAKRWVREAATDTFRHLFVPDESLNLAGVDKTIAEATDAWGAPPQCVIIDFVGSMAGDSESQDDGIKSKMESMKRWVKEKPFPTIAVTQNSRGNGGPGKPITLLSMGYGGEQEATFVLGVRRKSQDADLDAFEREQEKDSVTLHLVKNKRPPGKKTPYEGIDFHMIPQTGRIVDGTVE
mgnify:CR=1 FL=1